jgi:hypothetical protein
MTESFDVTFEISCAEYASVLRARLFSDRRFLMLMAVFIFIMAGQAYAADRSLAWSLLTIIVSLFCLRWWFAPAKWLKMQPHLSVSEKQFMSPQNRLGLATLTVKSEVPWTYFLCWSESPAYFMLDLSRNGFCSVIPKYAMTPEQQQIFRSWADAPLPRFPKRRKVT